MFSQTLDNREENATWKFSSPARESFLFKNFSRSGLLSRSAVSTGTCTDGTGTSIDSTTSTDGTDTDSTGTSIDGADTVWGPLTVMRVDVTKNWDSPAATDGGYWHSWPRGGAGNKQKFHSISFENSPSLPFSKEAQRNSRGLMDEESSGRKIWVICQVWRESPSRLLTRRKGGRLWLFAKLIFLRQLLPSRLSQLTTCTYNLCTHDIVRTNWTCEEVGNIRALRTRFVEDVA